MEFFNEKILHFGISGRGIGQFVSLRNSIFFYFKFAMPYSVLPSDQIHRKNCCAQPRINTFIDAYMKLQSKGYYERESLTKGNFD